MNTVRTTAPAAALAAALAFTAAAPLAHAAAPVPPAVSHAQNRGSAIGGVVGAVIGGPLGAVVGLIGGSALGYTHGVEGELSRSRAENARLKAEVAAMSRPAKVDPPAPVAATAPGKVCLAPEAVSGRYAFRTAGAALGDGDAARLEALGKGLATQPQVQVRLDGYADPRGPAAKNLALSRRRAEAVAAVLERAGVSATRITITAHGERKPGAPGAEGLFFDRDVQLHLAVPGSAR